MSKKAIVLMVLVMMNVFSFTVEGGSVMDESLNLACEQIKQFEGFRSTVYIPIKGDKKTIGYGFTSASLIAKGTMTRSEADVILLKEVKKYADVVDKYVKVKLTACQKAALISFCFNIGPTAFATSTLVKKLNSGDYDSVPFEMSRWCKKSTMSNGRKTVIVIKGLQNRRNKEINLWNGEIV